MDMLTAYGRVGRLRYFLTSVGITAIGYVLIVLFAVAPIEDDGGSAEGYLTNRLIFVSLIVIWLWMANAIRRLSDLGRPWFWVFIMFVPVAGFVLGLYLLFAPGNPNRGYEASAPPPPEPFGDQTPSNPSQPLLKDDGSFDMDGLFRDSKLPGS